MAEGKDGNRSKAALPAWLALIMQISGAALLLAGPVLHALSIAQGSAWHLMGGGVGLLVFASLDRLESFNAWGVSAKLREAQAAATEAVASAEEVRQMALPLARIGLGLVQASNRLGRDEASKQRVESEVKKVLDALKATHSERTACYTEWNAWRLRDKASEVFEAIKEAHPLERGEEIRSFRKPFNDPFRLGAGVAQQIRAGAKARGLLTPAVEMRISELETFEANLARSEASSSQP